VGGGLNVQLGRGQLSIIDEGIICLGGGSGRKKKTKRVARGEVINIM